MARDLELLRDKKITAVVNCTDDIRLNMFSFALQEDDLTHLSYQ